MGRIIHIALKIEDLEPATGFYETLFGFRQTGTSHARAHVSRHMTDGALDVALMVYDNEEVHEARLSGAGPCIHHWGIEVENRDATMALIEVNGGTIISEPGEGALKFRAPDGTVAEIVAAGRYKTRREQAGKCRIAHLALQVERLEAATRFYENVFGFERLASERGDGRACRHMTDGNFDLALLASDSQGAAPRIHHWGVEVDAPEAFAQGVIRHGGTMLSQPEADPITLRCPDGVLVQIARVGEFQQWRQGWT
jgi:catechol 2,3-dioxygenase-like lactoylglutathione lyase family enzyme